jgi:hypothetical protein
LQEPYLKKTHHKKKKKKKAAGVSQGVGSKFKTQYHQKKKKKNSATPLSIPKAMRKCLVD